MSTDDYAIPVISEAELVHHRDEVRRDPKGTFAPMACNYCRALEVAGMLTADDLAKRGGPTQ